MRLTEAARALPLTALAIGLSAALGTSAAGAAAPTDPPTAAAPATSTSTTAAPAPAPAPASSPGGPGGRAAERRTSQEAGPPTPPTSALPRTEVGGTPISRDARGRVETAKDMRGQIVRYTYDTEGRVIQLLFADALSCDRAHANCIEYRYDALGNLVTRIDNTGTTKFTYDASNRLIGKANASTGEADAAAYDANGNVLSLTSNGQTANYTYDGERVRTIREPGLADCGAEERNCLRYTYTKAGQLVSVAHPNGVVTTIERDAAGTPTASTTTGRFGTDRFTYQWETRPGEDDHRLISRSATLAGQSTDTTTYQYDGQGRLLSATTTGASPSTYTYTYDEHHNVLTATATVDGRTTTHTRAYNAGNQLCWDAVASTGHDCDQPPASATTFTYDARGNLRTGNHNASYNERNQTTKLDDGGALVYAGAGQAERVRAGGDGAVTNFVLGDLTSTRDGAATTYVRHPSGAVVAARTGAATTYYEADLATGNVIRLTDASGNSVGLYSYDPYGDHETATGTAALANPYRYQGAHKDASGLYHLGDRYYDPSTQRWTQQDRLDSGNRYAYVDGDPINRTDPTGYNWLSDRLKGAVETGVEYAGSGYVVGAAVGCGVGFVAAGPAGCVVAGTELGGALSTIGATAGAAGGAAGAHFPGS